MEENPRIVFPPLALKTNSYCSNQFFTVTENFFPVLTLVSWDFFSYFQDLFATWNKINHVNIRDILIYETLSDKMLNNITFYIIFIAVGFFLFYLFNLLFVIFFLFYISLIFFILCLHFVKKNVLYSKFFYYFLRKIVKNYFLPLHLINKKWLMFNIKILLFLGKNCN